MVCEGFRGLVGGTQARIKFPWIGNRPVGLTEQALTGEPCWLYAERLSDSV